MVEKLVKMNRNIVILVFVISAVLLVTEVSIFFNDIKIQSNQAYVLNQNPEMIDYLLGNYTLFSDNDIEYIKNARKYSEVNTYDLTNIALRGCDFYYDYLRTSDQKYAQLTLYYANFLLTEENHYDYGEYILFPSHLGYKIFNYRNLRKDYEDAMGASFAAILFINADELLHKLNITNNFYLESSQKVVQGLLLSYKDGGAKIPISDDECWFIHHAKQNRVLNGHMFTITNLFRYMNYTSDFTIEEEITKGITALKRNLHLYLRENKQLYDLKFFAEDVGYEPYFSPYYTVHPTLLYYIYQITKDVDFLKYYFAFMESSLSECLYTLDANPYLNEGILYLNLSMQSSVDNIFSSSTYPYELNPTADFYFREPFVNLDLLNSLNLSYSVYSYEENKNWNENIITNFTSNNFVNLTSYELNALDIEINTLSTNLKITCEIENDQIIIKNKKLVALDLSSKIQPNRKFGITMIYDSLIIITMICLIFIRKKLVNN